MTVMLTATGSINIFNILYKAGPDEIPYKFLSVSTLAELMNSKVKTTLGLNVTWEHQIEKVSSALYDEIMKPATHIGA